jgi:hypothetical protein
MNIRIVIVMAGYWVLIVGSQPISAQSMPGGNPAEGRSKEFARAVSTGSPDALKRLVAGRTTSSNPARDTNTATPDSWCLGK